MRILAPIIAFSCAFFDLACAANTIPAWIESPGRYHAADVPNAFVRTEKEIKNVLRSMAQDPEENLLRVGHVLGAYREYAMIVDEDGAHAHSTHGDKKAESAISLLERAFRTFGMNAVELDVHAIPSELKHLTANEVVVVHNQPTWTDIDESAAACEFLKKNTLRRVLDAYVAANRWQTGAKLYIEVKAPEICEPFEGSSPSECTRIGEAIARVIEGVPSEARKTIAFISFWPRMLDVVHQSLAQKGANVEMHDYVLILGPSSKTWAKLASGEKGNVPPFDQPKKKWLESTPWVTGVWASPSKFASRTLGTDMASINFTRQKANTSCLRVGVSSYQSNPEKFVEQFRQAWSVPKEIALPTCGKEGKKAPAIVESIIYDIDTNAP